MKYLNAFINMKPYTKIYYQPKKKREKTGKVIQKICKAKQNSRGQPTMLENLLSPKNTITIIDYYIKYIQEKYI